MSIESIVIVLLSCSLAIVFLVYLIAFYVGEYNKKALTKKQYLSGLFIPFYWWIGMIKEWIKEKIEHFNSLK